MKVQTYSNHSRYYYPHHFVFYPIGVTLFIISLSKYAENTGNVQYFLITSVLALVLWLSFMTRQHYGLVNQNRIIRLEMRLRYYQLTNHRFEAYEEKLSFSQIAALRFASDEELPILLQRTLSENLPSDTIKRSINNWQPDHMRL